MDGVGTRRETALSGDALELARPLFREAAEAAGKESLPVEQRMRALLVLASDASPVSGRALLSCLAVPVPELQKSAVRALASPVHQAGVSQVFEAER